MLARGHIVIHRTANFCVAALLLAAIVQFLLGCSSSSQPDFSLPDSNHPIKIVDTTPPDTCTYIGEVLSLNINLKQGITLGMGKWARDEHDRKLREYAASKGANTVVIVFYSFPAFQRRVQSNALYKC